MKKQKRKKRKNWMMPMLAEHAGQSAMDAPEDVAGLAVPQGKTKTRKTRTTMRMKKMSGNGNGKVQQRAQKMTTDVPGMVHPQPGR
jgi:hypothetical protein